MVYLRNFEGVDTTGDLFFQTRSNNSGQSQFRQIVETARVSINTGAYSGNGVVAVGQWLNESDFNERFVEQGRRMFLVTLSGKDGARGCYVVDVGSVYIPNQGWNSSYEAAKSLQKEIA